MPGRKPPYFLRFSAVSSGLNTTDGFGKGNFLHVRASAGGDNGANRIEDNLTATLPNTASTIATFTIDRLAFSMSPPLVAAVVDFDGGGRYPVEMTDMDPSEVKIGMRVEMTFRRLYTVDGIHNYFWKARPVR